MAAQREFIALVSAGFRLPEGLSLVVEAADLAEATIKFQDRLRSFGLDSAGVGTFVERVREHS